MKRTYLLSLLLLFFTTIVFIRVPFFDFTLLEDTTHLDSHPQFSTTPKTQILDLWKKPYLIYMPLTYSIWRVAGHLTKQKNLETIPRAKTGVPKEFRFNSTIFHLLPLAFHLGTVFILFWLLCFLTRHPLGSFFGALFFAIHPVQVESIAWVSGLKEPLAGFWGILSLFLFLIGQETSPKSKIFKFFFLCSTLSFLLSLFSNPSSITLPIAFSVLIYFPYKKERFLLSSKLLALWMGLAAPLIWLQGSTQSWIHIANLQINLKEKTILALDSLSFYFSKILLPLHLGVDYGRAPDWVLTQTSIYTTASVFFVFIFSLTLFLKWNKMNWALACEGFFLATLLPLFIFNRLLFQTSSSVADHDLYFALVGVALAIAFSLKFFIKKSWVQNIAVLILVILAIRTYFQTGYWKDTPTLLTHALEINSKSALAYRTLGYYFEREENYEKAISHFHSSSRLSPQISDFHQLGTLYLALKNFKEAKLNYEKALSINPLSSSDYHGLGLSWMGLGNKLLAQENFAKAHAFSPSQLTSLNALRQVKRELYSTHKTSRKARSQNRR